jgi:hypothetical protein
MSAGWRGPSHDHSRVPRRRLREQSDRRPRCEFVQPYDRPYGVSASVRCEVDANRSVHKGITSRMHIRINPGPSPHRRQGQQARRQPRASAGRPTGHPWASAVLALAQGRPGYRRLLLQRPKGRNSRRGHNERADTSTRPRAGTWATHSEASTSQLIAERPRLPSTSTGSADVGLMIATLTTP